MSKTVQPIFSYKSFIVSGLILRSLINVEFIFVYGVREYSNFFFSFLFFSFLGPHPRHMEVSTLGVISELQLSAYTTVTAMQDSRRVCDLYHSSHHARSPTP